MAAQQASLPVARPADPVVLRQALDVLTFRLDGSRAVTTIARKRAVLHGALDYAVEAGLLESNRIRPVLRKGLRRRPELSDRVAAEMEAAGRVGARLVTVLDPGYPANLRLIPNLPPFLFYRGEAARGRRVPGGDRPCAGTS